MAGIEAPGQRIERLGSAVESWAATQRATSFDETPDLVGAVAGRVRAAAGELRAPARDGVAGSVAIGLRGRNRGVPDGGLDREAKWSLS